MSKILSREQLNDDLWALKFRTTEVEMARDIADEIEDSHEALRERVEELERVAFLARAFQDDSTLETTASIDLSVELGAALRVLEACDE